MFFVNHGIANLEFGKTADDGRRVAGQRGGAPAFLGCALAVPLGLGDYFHVLGRQSQPLLEFGGSYGQRRSSIPERLPVADVVDHNAALGEQPAQRLSPARAFRHQQGARSGVSQSLDQAPVGRGHVHIRRVGGRRRAIVFDYPIASCCCLAQF